MENTGTRAVWQVLVCRLAVPW